MMDVQIDIESEYDLIQLLSEGWISKLYLAGNFSFMNFSVQYNNIKTVFLDLFYKCSEFLEMV